LIDAVVKDGFEALDGAMAVVDSIEGGVARLWAGTHAYRDWALANPTHYRVMFDAYVPDLALGPDAAARGGASFAAHRARVAYAVERGELLRPSGAGSAGAGSAGGEPDLGPATLDDLAHHIWACMHGHVLLQVLRGISRDDAQVRSEFDRAMGWLLRGLSRGADGPED
jgi:hypothetical protein